MSHTQDLTNLAFKEHGAIDRVQTIMDWIMTAVREYGTNLNLSLAETIVSWIGFMKYITHPTKALPNLFSFHFHDPWFHEPRVASNLFGASWESRYIEVIEHSQLVIV